jgi:hypothetical protein
MNANAVAAAACATVAQRAGRCASCLPATATTTTAVMRWWSCASGRRRADPTHRARRMQPPRGRSEHTRHCRRRRRRIARTAGVPRVGAFPLRRRRRRWRVSICAGRGCNRTRATRHRTSAATRRSTHSPQRRLRHHALRCRRTLPSHRAASRFRRLLGHPQRLPAARRRCLSDRGTRMPSTRLHTRLPFSVLPRAGRPCPSSCNAQRRRISYLPLADWRPSFLPRVFLFASLFFC